MLSLLLRRKQDIEIESVSSLHHQYTFSYVTIYRNVIVKNFCYTFLQLTIKTVYSFRFKKDLKKCSIRCVVLKCSSLNAVSYTHLTLPTKRIV